MALLVEALRYKPEGRRYNPRRCYWNFSSTYNIDYGSGVDSVSNRNEYQEYLLGEGGRLRRGRCVGLTALMCCLEIWEPQPPGTLRACPGIALPLPLQISSKSTSMLTSHLRMGLPRYLVHSGFPHHNLVCTSSHPSPPFVQHAPPISSFSILSSEYLMMSTNHEILHCAVSSISLLSRPS